MSSDDSAIGTVRKTAETAKEALGTAADAAMAEAQTAIAQTTDAAQDIYRQTRQHAEEAAELVQQKIREARVAVEDTSGRIEEVVRSSVEARPLMTVAVALGAGWILGRMLRNG